MNVILVKEKSLGTYFFINVIIIEYDNIASYFLNMSLMGSSISFTETEYNGNDRFVSNKEECDIRLRYIIMCSLF